MLGTSGFELFLIRGTITLFRVITPMSFCYCVVRPFIPSFRFSPLIDVWPVAEVCFYVFAFQPLKYRLQHRASHPPPLPEPERRRLFQRCIQNVSDLDAYLSKWFLGAPPAEIKRENVKEFYRWAFFNTENIYAGDEGELEGYVQALEGTLGRKLEPGRGDAECLRLSLDEVKMEHRPLFWYLIVCGVDMFTHLTMLWQRFHYHRTRLTFLPTSFPFRPHTLLTTYRTAVPNLSYWHKPHKSQTKLPILFLHGIGIGLYPYTQFFADLNRKDGSAKDGQEYNDEVGIIAIEILPVSFRITHPTLARQEMCRQIQTILLRHGFEKFVLVSHSYGSVITTHMLKDPEIAPQIASIVMVDPVSLLLHLPDVAFNFTHRQPRMANEWMLWWFASKDMGVAHALYRCFFWSENILWLEDLGDRKTSVFLSGRDLIVNTKQVAKYLLNGTSKQSAEAEAEQETRPEQDREQEEGPLVSEPEPESESSTGAPGVRVFYLKELDHAQIFHSKVRRAILTRETLKLAQAS